MYGLFLSLIGDCVLTMDEKDDRSERSRHATTPERADTLSGTMPLLDYLSTSEKILAPMRELQEKIDRIMAPSRKYQEAMEAMLSPSRKLQATMEAMDKMLAPTRKYQSTMEAMEKLLAPSRKFQATMEAMDKLLIPTRKYQTAMDSIGKALAPSREYQAAMEALEKRLTIARSHEVWNGALGASQAPTDTFMALSSVANFNQSSPSLKSILAGYESLQSSPIFKLLVSTEPEKVESLIGTIERTPVDPELRITDANPSAQAVEDEIVQSLQSGNREQTLSLPAIAFLIFFVSALHAFYSEVAKWNDFRESVCDIERRLQGFDSLAQARKLVRVALCDVPTGVKKSYRLTKSEGVNIRVGPGIKSEVIMTLPKFAVLEVIDSEDRDWLQVTYKHQGIEIEGWVSRKFVGPISRS